MKYRIILAAINCSVLAACATPYQQMGLMGGVQASRIDETTVQISARGNAFTDADTVSRYALRKAAEETVADGYDGFYVVSDQDRSRHGTIYTGGGSTTNFSGTAMGVGGNTAFINGTATTTYSPPQAYNFIKPGEAVTIKMFKGPKPSDAPGIFDAHELLRFMAPAQQAGNRPEPVKSAPVSYQPSPLPVSNLAPELKPGALEGALKQVAMGAKVPADVGENTTITKVEAVGTQLMVTASVAGQVDSVSDQQYANVASQICGIDTRYQILKAGASVHVVYLNSSGKNVGAIMVTRRECGI